MKFKIFIIALFMCLFQFNNAQNSSLLNFGINTDFITIPLTENSILSNNTVVNIGYNLNDNLNCKIGYEGSVIKENKENKYTNLSGLVVGFGYYLNNNKKNEFNTEFFASYTNDFNNFSSFDNYHSDLGIKFYYKKLFYIGTAVRYSNNNLTLSTNRNNLNWYWQMGIQLPVFKK